MNSHTPGPWSFRDKFVEHWREISSSKVEPVLIAELSMLPEYHANARLIAAAPDLLAACKALLSDYERLVETFGEQALVIATRAAIAKAEEAPNA